MREQVSGQAGNRYFTRLRSRDVALLAHLEGFGERKNIARPVRLAISTSKETAGISCSPILLLGCPQFEEALNENPDEHFTPRDVVHLMVYLMSKQENHT
jgi:hypothetical protein